MVALADDASLSPSLGAGFVDNLRRLWRARAFAWAIARSEMQSRHGNLILGWAWNLVDPLLMMAVYWFIFGLVLDSGRTSGFLSQLAIGIFLYQFSQNGATQGAASIESNREMIRQMHFPRAVLPLSEVLRNFVYLVWQLPVMGLIVISHAGVRVSGWVTLIVVLLPMFAVFTFGLSLALARATLAVRDVSRLIPYLFRLGFYLSGALFPLEQYLPESALLNMLILNPFYTFIALARSLLVTPAPQASLLWGAAVGWAAVALLLGSMLFSRAESRFGHA